MFSKALRSDNNLVMYTECSISFFVPTVLRGWSSVTDMIEEVTYVGKVEKSLRVNNLTC